MEPLTIRRVGLRAKEELFLESFSAKGSQFLEIINLQSLEEYEFILIPHQRDMSLHCFELYGVTGVVKRASSEKVLRVQKRSASRLLPQVLSSDDDLSDEESCASNRI
ncbi:hypothetical protein Dimus_019939 [Dionaea muscipula]